MVKNLFPKSGMLKTAIALLSSVAVIAGFVIAIPAVATAANYELLLMARKRNNPRISSNDTGHAWLVLIRNDGGGWQVDRTFAFWPWGYGLRTDNGQDRNNTERYLMNDFSFAPRGLAVRKIRLTPQKASQFKTILSNNWSAFGLTNCLTYAPFSVSATRSCNCLDFSSRAWVNLTGDWRSSMVLNVTPDQFVDRVNWANRQTGDFVR
jgi:hypothetical protein